MAKSQAVAEQEVQYLPQLAGFMITVVLRNALLEGSALGVLVGMVWVLRKRCWETLRIFRCVLSVVSVSICVLTAIALCAVLLPPDLL